MKLVSRLIFSVFSNSIALYAAAYFITGFNFSGGFVELIVAGAILSVINTFIRPVLKLILGPLIILTLGLFIIVVNATTLYILDIFSQPLTIQGYIPLLYASLLVGFVNFIISTSGKFLYKEE